MKDYPAERIHNIGLFGHIGCGKTTLAEALLFKAGALPRVGKVEDGTTTSDYDPDELRHHMSMHLSVLPLEWHDHKLNLVDTPGFADFLGDVTAALHAVDGAVIVIDATAGIEVGTERVWEQATRAGLPRILVINKLDRDNANFERCIAQARELFGEAVTPMQIPLGVAADFRGIIGLRTQQAWLHDGTGGFETTTVPAAADAAMHRWRTALIDRIAATNDDLIEHYFTDGEDGLSPAELRRGLHDGIVSGSIIPVFCTAATSMAGIHHLLNGFIDSIPPAAERAFAATDATSGEKVMLKTDVAAPAVAVIFKTLSDSYGRMSFFRMVQGTVRTGDTIHNANGHKDERNIHLAFVRGKDQTSTNCLGAGDIGVALKLNEAMTGDTLTAGTAIRIAPIPFPAPTFTAVVKPHGRHDLDKLGLALGRMAEEDPVLQIGRDSVTGDTLLSGLSETHIELVAERMAHKYDVNVDVALPSVPYRETIRRVAEGHYRHKKQTGGAGQFADVTLRVEPLPPDPNRTDPLEFVSAIVGGVISRGFWSAIEKGVREAMAEGIIAGNAVHDVRVVIFDGKEHPVDSKEIAFKTAGNHAFKLAAANADPVLLEPIYNLEITVPEQFSGDIMSDISTRRGRVTGMLPDQQERTVISAQVPLAECQRYSTELRSLTQARGQFSMQFAHYEEVPDYLIKNLIAQRNNEPTPNHAH